MPGSLRLIGGDGEFKRHAIVVVAHVLVADGGEIHVVTGIGVEMEIREGGHVFVGQLLHFLRADAAIAIGIQPLHHPHRKGGVEGPAMVQALHAPLGVEADIDLGIDEDMRMGDRWLHQTQQGHAGKYKASAGS